ncbi:hypothetical protein llap_18759 [Limosa lapponica baueri]|uniref:Alpha-2-macroglobulin bait region domain-containing protein n=1 Tax=Limosa lapponica baueri TaxID=1758121 RepID=A0A2I0TAV9_LIMLA|nr:hypothetical protein llap_18759 [Limosa lapponica baueri]
MQDPQRNRVYQWQGVELETGFTQLSFPLTSEPIQGSYKIVVQKSFSSHVEHSFSVEEYVLPKYEVLVKMPKVKLVDGTDAPIANETIMISVDGDRYKGNYTTDEQGQSWFSIDTTTFTGASLEIRADHKPELNCYDSDWITPSYEHDMRRISRFYSPIYGTFQLTFPVEAAVAPLARMLVYTTSPSGEVIASSADFQVESCLPNKVRLSFVPKEGLPASNTHLQLHASPRSLCALRAVDKSVLLMKPENELSPSSVYDLLPLKEIRGYTFKDYYLEEDNVNPCVSLDNILLNGFVYIPISPDGEGDAYDILRELGLKVFTSSKIHKPEICQHYPGHMMERSYGSSSKSACFILPPCFFPSLYFFEY